MGNIVSLIKLGLQGGEGFKKLRRGCPQMTAISNVNGHSLWKMEKHSSGWMKSFPVSSRTSDATDLHHSQGK